jgi:hypothetical protein
MRRVALILVVALLGMTMSVDADAGTERRLTYRATQVWSTAVRFLRVDHHYKIVEKDKETGYLLFEYKDRGRVYQASLELIPAVDNGYRIVRARMRIEGMPSYVAAVLLDKLVRKLKTEYGEPPPAQKVVAKTQSGNADDKKKNDDATGAEGEELEDEEDIEVDEDELEDSVEEDD